MHQDAISFAFRMHADTRRIDTVIASLVATPAAHDLRRPHAEMRFAEEADRPDGRTANFFHSRAQPRRT
jgi:hypothetical protein